MTLLDGKDTFDGPSGVFVEDTSPRKSIIYGIVTKTSSVDTNLASAYGESTKKSVMVSATGLTKPITPDMTLLIGTVEHEIVSCEPFSPAGLDVFYTLEVVV